MNRPRNRQPRQPRQPRPPRAANTNTTTSPLRSTSSLVPGPVPGPVPTSAHVLPGAHVFIVLKADQPTGRQTRGIVQDVLTAGDHPRGIKVRLRDGQVGRVQRLDTRTTAGIPVQVDNTQHMDPASRTGEAGAAVLRGVVGRDWDWGRGRGRGRGRYTDVREDGYLEGPPERNLADFFVHLPVATSTGNTTGARAGTRARTKGLTTTGSSSASPTTTGQGGSVAVACPICDVFEGDEAAVTHHLEREHLGY